MVGYGLDDDAGHVRFTRSSDYELLGGSQSTHEAMQAMADRIRDELSSLGYSLENITRDQVDEVRRIVERICGE